MLEAEELRAEHPGCGVEKMYDTLLPDFIGRDRFVDIFMDLGFRVKYPKNVNTQYNLPQSQTKESQRTAKATFAILNGKADAILSIYLKTTQEPHFQ